MQDSERSFPRRVPPGTPRFPGSIFHILYLVLTSAADPTNDLFAGLLECWVLLRCRYLSAKCDEAVSEQLVGAFIPLVGFLIYDGVESEIHIKARKYRQLLFGQSGGFIDTPRERCGCLREL